MGLDVISGYPIYENQSTRAVRKHSQSPHHHIASSHYFSTKASILCMLKLREKVDLSSLLSMVSFASYCTTQKWVWAQCSACVPFFDNICWKAHKVHWNSLRRKTRRPHRASKVQILDVIGAVLSMVYKPRYGVERAIDFDCWPRLHDAHNFTINVISLILFAKWFINPHRMKQRDSEWPSQRNLGKSLHQGDMHKKFRQHIRIKYNCHPNLLSDKRRECTPNFVLLFIAKTGLFGRK